MFRIMKFALDQLSYMAYFKSFPAAGDSARTLYRERGQPYGGVLVLPAVSLCLGQQFLHSVHNRAEVNRRNRIKRVIAKANGYFVDLVKTFES